VPTELRAERPGPWNSGPMDRVHVDRLGDCGGGCEPPFQTSGREAATNVPKVHCKYPSSSDQTGCLQGAVAITKRYNESSIHRSCPGCCSQTSGPIYMYPSEGTQFSLKSVKRVRKDASHRIRDEYATSLILPESGCSCVHRGNSLQLSAHHLVEAGLVPGGFVPKESCSFGQVVTPQTGVWAVFLSAQGAAITSRAPGATRPVCCKTMRTPGRRRVVSMRVKPGEVARSLMPRCLGWLC
jgi:hypothetical protein